jgi:hypothetical protein
MGARLRSSAASSRRSGQVRAGAGCQPGTAPRAAAPLPCPPPSPPASLGSRCLGGATRAPPAPLAPSPAWPPWPAELIDDKRVTKQLLERHLVALQGEAEEEQPVTVVSAFDVPKISYDPIHKKFFAEQRGNSLLGTAQVGAAAGPARRRRPVARCWVQCRQAASCRWRAAPCAGWPGRAAACARQSPRPRPRPPRRTSTECTRTGCSCCSSASGATPCSAAARCWRRRRTTAPACS